MCTKFEVNIFNQLKNTSIYGSIKLTIFRIKTYGTLMSDKMCDNNDFNSLIVKKSYFVSHFKVVSL